MKKLIYPIVAILAFFSSFLMGKTAEACSDSVTISLGNTSNFKGLVAFEGVKYTYGSTSKTSTWFYRIVVDSGSKKDQSHLNIQLGTCMTSSMLESGGTWSGPISSPTLSPNSCWGIGKDGSDPAKMWGIKYDCGLSKGKNYQIYFILKSDYAVTSNTIKLKAGTSFDSMNICGPDLQCGPVEVDLIKFNGIKSGIDNILTWTTASEINNAGFEIQRTTDQKNWNKVGFVKTQAESGNSIVNLFYNFTDKNAPEGSFYRLKQIDNDGQYEYSWPISIKDNSWYSGQFKVEIYPNPATNNTVLRLNSPLLNVVTVNQFEVFSLDGKKVLFDNFKGTSIKLDLSEIPPGIYIVMVKSGNFINFKKLLVTSE